MKTLHLPSRIGRENNFNFGDHECQLTGPYRIFSSFSSQVASFYLLDVISPLDTRKTVNAGI